MTISSDYATLDCKNYSVYYGYEWASNNDGDIFGFEIKDSSGEYRISAEDMNKIKPFNMVDCALGLLFGIELYFDDRLTFIPIYLTTKV